VSKKKYGGTRRRYATKKRTYRKKTLMGKKRILNLTSRKKRDTMLTVSNTDSNGASITPAAGSAYASATNAGLFLWCATARDLSPANQGASSTVTLEASRTATSCYMRGLSEKIRLQTSSGVPWFHRRICFTYKGADPFRVSRTGDTGGPQWMSETSNGIARLWFNASVNNTPNYVNSINGIVFKGTQGQDWNDVLTAPVDNRRVTLKFDKTWTLQSSNNNGLVRERKLWHGMNKTLVYDDDEGGAFETQSNYSVESKAGMGDYYVMDYFIPGAGGTSSDLIRIDSTSTLYWHEK